MNENVKYGLENYLRDVDPQYAVLLTGDWGCGKTYFVKEWLKDVEQRHEDYPIKPVYISLFGVSSMPALIEKVNKSLSPMMYNFEKYGKRLLKIAGKVVLKYDNTFDAIGDAKLAYEINPLDLLSIKDEEEGKISAQYKLFVFDDIERCKIAPEELMGFFDLCLEQLGCRLVVIRGSSNAQTKDQKKVLETYQEKIFSREFEIKPDVTAAIDYFANELSVSHPMSCALMKKHAEAIADIFRCSTYQNLRTLRHGMRSFSEVFENLTHGADDFELSVLLQYLAVSLEYQNENRDCLLSLGGVSFLVGFGKNETAESRMVHKYVEIQQKYRTSVFASDMLDTIKASVTRGTDISMALNERISKMLNKSLSERLRNVWNLDNPEAELLIRESKRYTLRPVDNVSEYIFVVYMLCYLEDIQVVVLKKDFEESVYVRILRWMRSLMSPDNFVQIDMAIEMGCSIQGREKRLERFTKLYENHDEAKAEYKEPIVFALEKVSNETMANLARMMADTDPQRHATYDMQAVFNKVNVPKMCGAICRLNNYNKRLFADILTARYKKNWELSSYVSLFGEERNALIKMLNYFRQEERKATRISRIAISTIVRELQYAVAYFDTEDGSVNDLE